ncbi:MAG: hypothetical protein ACYTGR_07110 [Planctomycetota bacterium]
MDLISKPFYLTAIIGSAVAFIVAFAAAMYAAGLGDAGANEAMVFMLAGFFSAVVGFCCWLALVYRLWSTIEQGAVRTTPAKAVGFLFIPFFNLYWMFQAHWGWAEDYNRYIEDRGIHAPRMTPGVPMAACLLGLTAVIPLLGAITGLVAAAMMMIFFNKAITAANAVIMAHMVETSRAVGTESHASAAMPNATPPYKKAA